MKVQIHKSIPCGEAVAPPSKSLAHRALICGALSEISNIKNLAFSKDITATLGCLKSLGADCEISDNTVKIGNINLFDIPENAVLDCNESGSTLRFLLPMCLLSGKKVTLKGAKRLFERPLEIYEKICAEQGIFYEKSEDSVTVRGRISSGSYKIPGNVSSQFITGLLFTLPLLNGISILEITGDFESASYVDLTLDMLSRSGIKITRSGNRFIVMGNQKYSSFDYTVEGDCSNAAFLDALNYIGGNVTVKGLSDITAQGDNEYKNIFNGLDTGIKEFDLSDCPDLAPISFALAAIKGGAEFKGTARLRLKESDRAQAMKEELQKFGVKIEIGDNFVIIPSADIASPTEVLDGHNDHRIVMALAVLSSVTGGVIQDAEAVSKSYPDFFDVLKSLNVRVAVYED